MTLIIEQTNKGKPCLVIGKYKYRESYKSKGGDVTWRCLAKTCGASVKTNAARTEIVSHEDVHTGTHPVTNRTVRLSGTPTRTPLAATSVDMPLSPLISQLMVKKDMRDAFTETDPLFLKDRDELVNRVQELIRLQSALVDKIQDLTIKLEAANQKLRIFEESEQKRNSVRKVGGTDSTDKCLLYESYDRETITMDSLLAQSTPESHSQSVVSHQTSSVNCTSPHVPSPITHPQRSTGRLLTDDEVWAGIKHLNANGVHVLTPTECLNIRLMPNTPLDQILCHIKYNDIILAPISNSVVDLTKNCNTEGTHWSLVVIDMIGRRYFHLDSLPGLNTKPALEFCKAINKEIKFDKFLFLQKKCKKQTDSFSCGNEVIRNAEAQVIYFKSNTVRKENRRLINESRDMSCNVTPSLQGKVTKRKLITAGDSHVRGLAGMLQPLLADWEVVEYCYPGASMLSVLFNLSKKVIGKDDIILLIGGTNDTSPVHNSRYRETLFHTIKNNACKIILTEVPMLVSANWRKCSEINSTNNMLFSMSLQTDTPFLLINHFLASKHYVKNGQHINDCGKRLLSSKLGGWISHLLKTQTVTGSPNMSGPFLEVPKIQ